MRAGEPNGLVGVVDEDVHEMHATPIVASGEALAAASKVESEELEVAIEAGDLPPARHLPEAQCAVA